MSTPECSGVLRSARGRLELLASAACSLLLLLAPCYCSLLLGSLLLPRATYCPRPIAAIARFFCSRFKTQRPHSSLRPKQIEVAAANLLGEYRAQVIPQNLRSLLKNVSADSLLFKLECDGLYAPGRNLTLSRTLYYST